LAELTKQDIENLIEFFDGSFLDVDEVINYTGLPADRAKEVFATIEKLHTIYQL
jgi:hypothetical protein